MAQWTGRGGLLLAVALGLLVGPWAWPAAADDKLDVDPPVVDGRAEVVGVDGACPGWLPDVDDIGGETLYPPEVEVLLRSLDIGDETLERQMFPVLDEGTFAGDFQLPDDLPPTTYTLGIEVPQEEPGTWPDCLATTRLVVNPFLELSHDELIAGGELTASGTCPTGTDTVEVRLADEVGVGPVDPLSGRFAGVALTVPAEAVPGSAIVTSTCGTEAELAVVAAPVTPSPVTPSPITPSPVTPSPVTPSPVTPSPQTDPPSELVVVPDLVGLTPDEARDRLGTTLVLDVSGIGERVASQSPEAGAQVPPGTTVTVTLDEAAISIPESITAVVPAWSLVVAVLLGAVAAGRPLIGRAVRSVRERRWVRRAAFRARRGRWHLPDQPEEAVPAVGVHFRTEFTPDPMLLEEVSGART